MLQRVIGAKALFVLSEMSCFGLENEKSGLGNSSIVRTPFAFGSCNKQRNLKLNSERGAVH
jgi:hypothetical protein